MLRKLSILSLLIAVPLTFGQTPPAAHVDHPGLKKLGWQLACQMSTFQDRTVFETLDFLHAQGFHHIELSPGQILSSDKDVKVGPDMSQSDIDALTAKLKAVHLDIVSYGVTLLPSDVIGDGPLRPAMEFARKLKAKNVVVQGPLPPDAEKLADELAINIAVLGTADLPEGKRIGRCIDAASGASSTTRAIEVHLGAADSSALLTALKDQNFKGVCAVKCNPATGKDLDEKFIGAVNTFSDQVTKLAQ